MSVEDFSSLVTEGVRRTAQERDLWMDLFTNYSELIMGSTLEEHSGLKGYPEEQLKTDITLAARLADHALSEVAYSNARHKPEIKRIMSKRPPVRGRR